MTREEITIALTVEDAFKEMICDEDCTVAEMETLLVSDHGQAAFNLWLRWQSGVMSGTE
jgi:hypothetical protein